MAFSVFGRKSASDIKKQAKKDFELALSLRGDVRSDRAFKVKIGLRSRAHIDKTFIHGAKISEAYHDAVLAAVAEGNAKPEPPKPPLYQSIKTGSEEILAYVPESYSDPVLRYGMRYQVMDVDAQQAINAVQNVMDTLLTDLDINHPLKALNFLREEIGDDS
tara:strand:- start:1328 stop:1813 length:486 start_codon:yes stop_codon:yes gene_type:complete